MLPTSDVDGIKTSIVDFMIQLPPNLQVQVGEAISVIAESDFPDRWNNLIPHLVSKISNDVDTNNGVLTVAHSVLSDGVLCFALMNCFGNSTGFGSIC